MSEIQDNIIQGCLRRDRASQRELYNQFFGYGLSITLRYCDDRDQAVVALNDAFLTVFRKLDRFDQSADFKPWFRTIVVRAAIDYLKKIRKQAPLVELEEHTPVYDREDILSRIGYEELLSMVKKLSLGYRTVFNLYVIDGFKHEEIAERLGISVGTSKSNLFKARNHLKKMVEQSLNIKSIAIPA